MWSSLGLDCSCTGSWTILRLKVPLLNRCIYSISSSPYRLVIILTTLSRRLLIVAPFLDNCKKPMNTLLTMTDFVSSAGKNLKLHLSACSLHARFNRICLHQFMHGLILHQAHDNVIAILVLSEKSEEADFFRLFLRFRAKDENEHFICLRKRPHISHYHVA